MANPWKGTPGEDDGGIDEARRVAPPQSIADPSFEGRLAGPAPAAAPTPSLLDLLNSPEYDAIPTLDSSSKVGSVSLSAPADVKIDPNARGRIQSKLDEGKAAIGTQDAAVQGALDAQKNAMGDLETGSLEAQKRYRELHEQHVQPLLNEQARLADEHKAAVEARDAYQERMNGALTDMDKMAKQIASQQPQTYFANAGLPMKIASMLLAAVGGAAQAIGATKDNPVIEAVHNLVQQDAMIQRMRFEKNQNDYANQKTMVGQLAQYYDHAGQAENAAYVTAMQGITARMQVLQSLFKEPQMRQNMEFMKAQLETKFAPAVIKAQEDAAGKMFRLSQGAATLEKDLTIAEMRAQQGQQTVGLRAQAEARAKHAQGQKDASLEVPGFRFKDGFKAGTTKDAAALANLNGTTLKVDKAMEDLKGALDRAKTSPGLLASIEASREYKQLEALLFEAARGQGFGQTGSRFTEMVKELEKAAFTPGTLGRLTPDESKRLLARAQISIRRSLIDAAKVHGGIPSKHELLGGE